MPPIEMIASPVGNRISIPIPREYRAYSFQVTLVPVKAASEVPRRRVARTRRKETSASLWDQLACPVFDEGDLIAATASVHKMKLVTRNEKDMSGMGVPLLNPFG